MDQAQTIGQGERALTISSYVWVTDVIADVVIENANEAAAKLYGYPSAEALAGTYLSETMSKEDMLRGTLISLSQLNRGETTRYVQRIRQPLGNVVYVFKETHRLRRGDAIQYVTFLDPASAADLEPAPTPQSLGITAREVEAYRGKMNVSELREMMQGLGIQKENINFLTPYDMHTILSVFQTGGTQDIGPLHVSTNKFRLPPGEPIELLPGQTRALPDGRFLHRCGRCLRIWHSVVEHPSHCPRPRPDKTGPKCGTRSWRFIHPS